MLPLKDCNQLQTTELVFDKEGLSQRPVEKDWARHFGVQSSDGLIQTTMRPYQWDDSGFLDFLAETQMNSENEMVGWHH